MLRKQNPLPSVDDSVGFDPEAHAYDVEGVPVPISVTGVVEQLFPRFKPRKTVELHYETWKASGRKYRQIIGNAASDEDAKKAIVKLWTDDTTARDMGTLVHACVEQLLNRQPVDPEARGQVFAELNAFEVWLEGSGLTPVRTELPVFAKDNVGGAPVLAGTIDALFRDAEGQLWLLDWKRTSKPFGPKEWAFRRHGHGPAIRLSDTKHAKYSVQLALYALLLREATGLDVADRRLLARFAPGSGEVEEVPADTSPAVEEAAAAALARLKAGEPVLAEGEGSSSDEGEECRAAVRA